MKHCGRLAYYESKLRLLNTPNVDAVLLQMGCWDAPVDARGLYNRRRYRSFVKKCRRHYQKKIKRILNEN
jgi:hypothetical protein